MLIHCTKKLLDQLKIKPESPLEEDELFSWHANLLTVNRKKAVVLVNDSNRYVIVLYGLLAKDFKKLDMLITEAIRKTFGEEGIKEEVIDQFIQHSPTFTYTKTKDRTSVARMNKSCEPVYIFDDLLDNKTIVQTALSLRASRYLVGNGKNDYIHPNRELYNDLKAFAGNPVIEVEAIQLKVTLNLEHFHVWRRLVVPLHLTFHELHQILQAAFGWHDYHLHEFYIYDEKIGNIKDNEWNINHSAFHKEGKKPILNIVSDEEALNYGEDIPTKLETGIKLSDYFPTYKTMKYNYDFGDGWRHDIEVEAFIDQYDNNYPVCLEGNGDTPPEDVGGEQGYEEFQEIIADENHTDHKQMVAWGKMQRYEVFDIKMVNLYLKSRFY